MKMKQKFSILLALTFILMIFNGCQAVEKDILQAGGEQRPAGTVASQQRKDIDVQLYPADIQFVEYAELTLSDSPEREPIEENPPEETEPPETTEILETTQPTELIESVVPDPAQLQNNGLPGVGGTPDPENSEDTQTIVAFRGEEETDLAEGKAIYPIRIQYQNGKEISVLNGTLFPGEKLKWDESTQAAENANVGDAEAETSADASSYTEAILKMKLEEALLGDVEWVSCVEADRYAYNQELTKCAVLGQMVLYTNDEYTVLQVQSYDVQGKLNCVAALSENNAKALLNGTASEIQWNAERFPVMHLTMEETVVLENPDYQNLLVDYEELVQNLQQQNQKGKIIIITLGVTIMVLVVTNLVCVWRVLCRNKQKSRKAHAKIRTEQRKESVTVVKSIGTVHNIGGRSGQQDSYDVINCAVGTLAVVADGMGGLTDGDKVSQKIVATMRSDSARIRPGQTDYALCQMVAHANQEVNRMLGAARQYKCGSTLLAVLVENDTMQWITVGDSRICLYRGGNLIQINREHIYCTELLEKAINGKLSFAEALRDPQADRLSSFVGMGDLKHVDICLNRLKLCSGDRILLMSDGVFNTLSNEEISRVLHSSSDATSAAAHLEQKVLQKNAPNQDNFTCVILEV